MLRARDPTDACLWGHLSIYPSIDTTNEHTPIVDYARILLLPTSFSVLLGKDVMIDIRTHRELQHMVVHGREQGKAEFGEG